MPCAGAAAAVAAGAAGAGAGAGAAGGVAGAGAGGAAASCAHNADGAAMCTANIINRSAKIRILIILGVSFPHVMSPAAASFAPVTQESTRFYSRNSGYILYYADFAKTDAMKRKEKCNH
jgi:hypothetical protein